MSDFKPTQEQFLYAESYFLYILHYSESRIAKIAGVTLAAVKSWKMNIGFVSWFNDYQANKSTKKRMLVKDQVFEQAMCGDIASQRVYLAITGGAIPDEKLPTEASSIIDSSGLIPGGVGISSKKASDSIVADKVKLIEGGVQLSPHDESKPMKEDKDA